MSHPQSRSPLCSRIPALLGRRADVFFDDQMRLNAQSDSWRKAEAGSKGEGKPHWNKDHHHGEQSVDHWANFIDAIKHAQERSGVSAPEYGKQGEERRPTHCPRRLPREMLSSPKQERFGAEERFKNLSSRVDRNEAVGKSEGRQDPVFHLKHREIKDESHPRHSDGRRHDRMEYGYLNKDHQEQYHDRGGFSERSSKSDNRERHRSPGFTHFGERDAFSEHHGDFSPRQTPVIVEHGHGFGRQDFRDGQRMRGYWKSKGSQPQGRGGIPSNPDPLRAQREQDCHSNALQGRSSGHPSSYVPEEPRRYHPYQKVSREKDRPRPFEHSRMDSNLRDSEKQRQMDARGAYDIDLRSQANHFGNEWDGGQRNHGRMMEQELRQRPQFHRKSNNHVAPTPRQDFSGHETLRIKVDMSRPVGQSSHLGYSSDRQLSLDLVNVGRQRLDFLPMLEHSGVYKESAIHSGTFAQEIINLVHQVKENYFPGQGITLNERFMREQYDSLQGASRDENDDEDLSECVRPVMNRLGMLKPHVFCKVEPEHPEAHQFTPDPGDLRYDLERRRQQRQENVKITIAGGNFAQVIPQCQESEARYLDKDPEAGDFRWSEQAEPQRQWNGSHQRNHGSHRQNFAPRGNFNSNTRPFGRRF